MTVHRQIHLDFHTPAGVTVGDKFNATEFFDTLVSPAQMKYQVATHLMVGASSCIGDHMHCNGALGKAVYLHTGYHAHRLTP